MRTLFKRHRVLLLRAMALLSALGCAVLLWWIVIVAAEQEVVSDKTVPGGLPGSASGNQPNGSANGDSLADRLESDAGSQAASDTGSQTASGTGGQAGGDVGGQEAGRPESRHGTNPVADASGRHDGADAMAGECPVRLPADCQPIGHSVGANIERWQARSSMSCRGAAYELLLELRSDGFTLNKADFLGLSDELWGCTVTSAAGEVFVISMIPESPGSVRNEDNQLVVTVVRIFNPEYDTSQEAGQGIRTRSEP